MFKSFQEYIDQNKKVVEKPKVSKVADFEGKQPSKPEKEKKRKDSGGAEQVGDVKPYSNGENAKDPNKDDKSGLVHQGDKGLVYEPDVDEKSKETKTWPKTGVSEWLRETKNMSVAELASKIKQEEGDCSKGMYDLSKKIVEACQCNKKNILTLVREAKRGNILSGLLKEVFNTPESYEILSRLIESKKYSSKFDKMFNEMVAEPVGMGKEGEDMEDLEGDDDMKDMEDMEGDEDMDDDEDMGDMDDDEDMGDMDDDEDVEGMDDDEDMEGMDDDEDMEGMGDDEDMGDMEGMEDEEGMGDMEDDMKMRKKESPHSNNPFVPKEATWHFDGIDDAPTTAHDTRLGMRGAWTDKEEEPSAAKRVYSDLESELASAKAKVKEIERRMIRFLQMRGRSAGI